MVMLISGAALAVPQSEAGLAPETQCLLAPRLVLAGERGQKGWGPQGCWAAANPRAAP